MVTEKNISITPEKYLELMGFFNIAYYDYVAARTLFNHNQLYRAIILANTSIEKYFKVYLAINGASAKTHNVNELFIKTQKFDPTLKAKINIEFIGLITKAYHMRYFDDKLFSKSEFDLCVCKYKTLAELDETVAFIENSWIVRKNGQPLKRRFHSDVEAKESALYENNFFLNGIDKTKYIEVEELVYEIRNTKQEGVAETYYTTLESKNDGKFL